jgi:hypothetical protein
MLPAQLLKKFKGMSNPAEMIERFKNTYENEYTLPQNFYKVFCP